MIIINNFLLLNHFPHCSQGIIIIIIYYVINIICIFIFRFYLVFTFTLLALYAIDNIN